MGSPQSERVNTLKNQLAELNRRRSQINNVIELMRIGESIQRIESELAIIENQNHIKTR